MIRTLGLAFLIVTLTFCESGCSKSDGKVGVKGKISFKGTPLDKGSIEFHPVSPDLKSFSGATIENGAYAIPAEKGLQPGEYKVMISSADQEGATEEVPGESNQLAKDRIPPEYNVNTKLTVTLESGKENTFDVEIK